MRGPGKILPCHQIVVQVADSQACPCISMQIARVCLNVDLSGARTVECFYARNLLHKHRAVRQKMPCFGQHTTIGENAREDKEDPNFGEDHEQLKSFEVFGVRGVNVVKLSITPRMISPSQVKGSKGEEDSAV